MSITRISMRFHTTDTDRHIYSTLTGNKLKTLVNDLKKASKENGYEVVNISLDIHDFQNIEEFMDILPQIVGMY
jgi:diphthamide synthase subunit DPH2